MNKTTKAIYAGIVVGILTIATLLFMHNPPKKLAEDIREAKEITQEKLQSMRPLEIPEDADPDQVRAFMEE